jgi:hypothetical protein
MKDGDFPYPIGGLEMFDVTDLGEGEIKLDLARPLTVRADG